MSDKLSTLRKARCECGHVFPVAVGPGEYRYPDVVCPKCGRRFLIKKDRGHDRTREID